MTDSAHEQPRDEPLSPARTNADYVELFVGYAKAARGTALRSQSRGDLFGEKLANARAQVYDQAANVVRQHNVAEATRHMLDSASRAHVRTAPLMDFDNAGLAYIASRAWQFCALTLDPTAPEVAAKWD